MDLQDFAVQAPDQWCHSAFSPGIDEDSLTFNMSADQTIRMEHVNYWMGHGRAHAMPQSSMRELCFQISSPVQRQATIINAFENEAAMNGFAEFLLSFPRVEEDRLSVVIHGDGEEYARSCGPDFWKFLGRMKVITALNVSFLVLSDEGHGSNFRDAIQALDRPAPDDGQEYQGLSKLRIADMKVGSCFMDNLASGLRNMTHLNHVIIYCVRGQNQLDPLVPALKAGSSATLYCLHIDKLEEANSLVSLGMDFPALSVLTVEPTNRTRGLTNIKEGLHQNTTIQQLYTRFTSNPNFPWPNLNFPWVAEFSARNQTLKQLSESSSLLALLCDRGVWTKCIHHLGQSVHVMQGHEAAPVRSSALFKFLRETVIPQHFASKDNKSTSKKPNKKRPRPSSSL